MPATVLQDYTFGALTLADYARITGYDECAFWGVYYNGQIEYDCRMFWTEWQRMDILRALNEAQRLIEDVVGYPLSRTWITSYPSEFGEQDRVDVQPYGRRILLKYGHLIGGGVKTTSILQNGSVINHATDPAVVGPLAVTLSDVAEVKVFYPGTKREITPSKKVYSGGNLTLYIPRCRLVLTPNQTDDGKNYDDLANFLTTVDVIREYNDPSTAGLLVHEHGCNLACQNNNCADYTTTGCIYPLNNRLGIVTVIPATYSSNTWVENLDDCCHNISQVRLNYLAGINKLDSAAENAIVRLAHARMAAEPCGCQIIQRLWERDRKTPDVLSRERLNCPFGPSEGSWVAYKFAQSRKIVRMGLF